MLQKLFRVFEKKNKAWYALVKLNYSNSPLDDTENILTDVNVIFNYFFKHHF